MVLTILLFLLCSFIFIGILITMVKHKKVKKMTIVLCPLLLILGLLSVKIMKGFIPMPMAMRSMWHLISSPADLCQPIVIDKFRFYEKGFSRTYLLKPKYLDRYEIGFLSEKEDKLINYFFNGKIKAEFFWMDKLLYDEVTDSGIRGGYAEIEGNYFKEVSFLKFKIPLQGRYKENISVKLTVIEPDEDLEKYGDSIKLFIRVNSHP